MSLAQLPDELLISVFERLSLKERHRALPLVSRRCWQLVCSPQLLHSVDVTVKGDDEEAMARLRSLARFLFQHGAGRVRQLQLDLGYCRENEESAPECLALVAAVSTACSGLQELDLTCEPTVVLSSWLLPLGGSLRRLRTQFDTSTAVAGSLEFLTALQDLELGPWSEGVDFAPDAQLPISLTRLVLGGGGKDSMPPQIGMLRHLHTLQLRHPYKIAASCAPLTSLSLHTLKLTGCVPDVPDCLSALTSLQSLTVDGCNMEDEQEAAVAAGLASALPHLTRLTRLELALCSPGPLAALTALTGLRWLCWPYEVDGDAAALPPGNWVGRLQTLAAPHRLVARSLPALKGAQSLERLCVYRSGESNAAQLRATISWAARHTSLRQLLLGSQPLTSSVWPEISAAARLHPTLSITADTIYCPDF